MSSGEGESATPTRRPSWLRLGWISALVAVWLGLAAYDLHGSLPGAMSASPAAQAHPVAHRPAARGERASFAPRITTPRAIPARRLVPAGADALNPYANLRQGDHGDLAYRAIDDSLATAWQTDWYTTPHFGGLYPGTGLLVDLGRATTITAVRIALGPAQGAAFQVRIGAAQTLAALQSAAPVANAGGVVRVKLTKPAHGRYVLIWFTRLPADPVGTFQASVYDVRLLGRPDARS